MDTRPIEPPEIQNGPGVELSPAWCETRQELDTPASAHFHRGSEAGGSANSCCGCSCWYYSGLQWVEQHDDFRLIVISIEGAPGFVLFDPLKQGKVEVAY